MMNLYNCCCCVDSQIGDIIFQIRRKQQKVRRTHRKIASPTDCIFVRQISAGERRVPNFLKFKSTQFPCLGDDSTLVFVDRSVDLPAPGTKLDVCRFTVVEAQRILAAAKFGENILRCQPKQVAY